MTSLKQYHEKTLCKSDNREKERVFRKGNTWGTTFYPQDLSISLRTVPQYSVDPAVPTRREIERRLWEGCAPNITLSEMPTADFE